MRRNECITDVENGNATISIPTTDLESGRYKVEINYNGNAYYNNSTIETLLTLSEPEPFLVGSGTDTVAHE